MKCELCRSEISPDDYQEHMEEHRDWRGAIHSAGYGRAQTKFAAKKKTDRPAVRTDHPTAGREINLADPKLNIWVCCKCDKPEEWCICRPMSDAEIYKRAFGQDATTHILKLIKAVRASRAEQAGASAHVRTITERNGAGI